MLDFSLSAFTGFSRAISKKEERHMKTLATIMRAASQGTAEQFSQVWEGLGNGS